MQKKSTGYYAVIPASIRYDTTICASAKLLYGEITALCNQEGYCWATTKYFTELYNASKRSVIRWINELIDGDYIVKKIKYESDGKTVRYRCLSLPFTTKKKLLPCFDGKKLADLPSDKNAASGDKNVTTPSDKNVKYPSDKNVTHNIIYKGLNIKSSSSFSKEEDEEDKNPQSELAFYLACLNDKIGAQEDCAELKKFASWVMSRQTHKINGENVPLVRVAEVLLQITVKVFFEEHEKVHLPKNAIGQKETYLLTCIYNRLLSGV